MRLLSDRVEKVGGVMSGDGIQAAYVRQAAKAEIQTLDEFRVATLAQHTEMFKWITASLLAINGAAAVAMIGADAINAVHKICAGANFVVGVFLAINIGVAAQLVSARGLKPLQELKGYWIAVEIDGERIEDLENTLHDNLRKSMRWSWIVPALGWVSGIFFAVGLAVVAHGILENERSEGNGNAVSLRNSALINCCLHDR